MKELSRCLTFDLAARASKDFIVKKDGVYGLDIVGCANFMGIIIWIENLRPNNKEMLWKQTEHTALLWSFWGRFVAYFHIKYGDR